MTADRPAPKVSVVMAVLRPHPAFFPAAVRSVLAQTLRDLELIVVEDPSDRPAGPLLRSLCDPRIRHLANYRRTSLVAQRNRGLAAARAPLVAVIDGDDVAAPDRLEKQVRYLEAHPEVDVLGSMIRVIDEAGAVVGYREFPLGHDDIVRAMRRVVPLAQPAVMFRRDAVAAAGGYRFPGYAAAEDYELWSRLARGGVKFANHPEVLLDYRLHRGQMKYTHLRETVRAILRVKALYWRDQMGLPSRARAWAERLTLVLPKRVVMWLFARTQYRTRPPGQVLLGVGQTGPSALPGWRDVGCRATF